MGLSEPGRSRDEPSLVGELAWLGVVRHAESAANVAAVAAEATGAEALDLAERDPDVPLSPYGREQAADLGRWLVGLPPGRRPEIVVSSPYLRTVQTASIALAAAGEAFPIGEPELDERLRDREPGVLELLTPKGVANRHPDEAAALARQGLFYHRPRWGESWADVALRLRSLLGDLRRECSGRRVLLVSHEAPIFVLRYIIERIPERELTALAVRHHIANCSLTAWTWDAGRPLLEAFDESRR